MSLLLLIGLGMAVTTPQAAQTTLAGALADADSVDWVRADGHAITFGIDRAGEAYALSATTNDDDVVTSLKITDLGPAPIRMLGPMSWLADAMADTSTAVTELVVGADGAVTVVTGDGDRYLAIPTGAGTNAAVEARWADAWAGPNS